MLGKLPHGVDLLLKGSHAVFGDAVSQELDVCDAEDAFVFSGDEAVFAEWLEDDSKVWRCCCLFSEKIRMSST